MEDKNSQLLRILIGYMHVVALTQLSQSRYAKPPESLEAEQRQELVNEIVGQVGLVGRQLDEAFVKSILEPPSTMN
jgi:hypothetical protein